MNPDLAGLFGRPLGTGHARGDDGRVQRQGMARRGRASRRPRRSGSPSASGAAISGTWSSTSPSTIRKPFARPFTLHTEKPLAADTELLEDVCENERSGAHLTSGLTLTPEVLAKYAGTYQFASGRQAVVKVAGEQLQIEDSASPLDRLFVAGSETVFLSSLSQIRDRVREGRTGQRDAAGPEERRERRTGRPKGRRQ